METPTMTERQDCREAFLDQEDYQNWRDECNEDPSPEDLRREVYVSAEVAYNAEENPEVAEELFTDLIAVNYQAVA
jgi:hypothetical protein